MHNPCWQRTKLPQQLSSTWASGEIIAKPISTAHISSLLHAQVIRNAKLWCDVESVEEAKHLSKQWDWTLVPGFTASKILWLKNNEPENFSKLAKVLLPHDYFNYYLTGRYCMEASFWAWHVLAHHACPPHCAVFNAKACTALMKRYLLLDGQQISCASLSGPCL